MFISVEIQKQINKVLICALAVMSVLNVLMAFKVADETNSSLIAAPSVMSEIYDLYTSDPEYINSYYKELSEYKKNQSKIKNEAEENGIEFTETRRSIWTSGLYTDDISIIKELREFEKKQASYSNEVALYIRNARTNMQEFLNSGYSESSFEYRNQEKVSELYTAVSENVELHTAFISGWNDFYSFSLGGISAILISLIAGIFTFAYEKESGMMPVIKSCRNGRIKVALSKLFSAICISAISGLIITFSSFAVFAIKEGFNGGDEPVQALDCFRKSYLLCSIREYLGIYLLQRLFSCAVFAIAGSLFSVIFYNYVLSFSSSLFLTAINTVLFNSGNDIVQNTVRYVNLYSPAEGTRLFARWCAADILDFPVPYYILCLSVFSALALLSAVAICAIWSHNNKTVNIGFITNMRQRILEIYKTVCEYTGKARNLTRTGCTTSLWNHELFKINFGSFLGIISVILCICGIISFAGSDKINAEKDYSQQLFTFYLSEYEGEWTEEKDLAITARLNENSTVIHNYSAMSDEYSSGNITADEYKEYLVEYNNASRNSGGLKLLYNRSQYLRKIYENSGIRAWFIDTDGWTLLLERNRNWYLYAAIIIFTVTVFSQEYGRNSFSAILRTAKHGRKNTFFMKILISALIPALLGLLCESAEIIITAQKVGITSPSAPAQSIELLSALDADISIAEFILYDTVVKIIACAFLGIIAATASAVFRKALPALACTSFVTMLPTVTNYIGITDSFTAADFMVLFGGNRLVLYSAGIESLADFTLTLIVILTVLIISVICIFISHLRFNHI